MDSVTRGNRSNDGNFRDAKDEVVTDEQLQNISEKIFIREWKRLARKLGLDEGEIDAIENDYKDDTKEKHIQMLLKWRRKFGSEATKKILQEALHKLNRRDLFSYLTGDSSKVTKKVSMENQLTELQEYLMELYKDLQLPIETFLPDRCWLLDEHYVDLTMKLKDKYGKDESTFHIEEIFTKIDRKIPKKIFVESDPGYGKTTLGLKLAADWSNGRGYTNEMFDLVFHVSLTHFTGDLNKILLNKIKEIDDVSQEEKLDIIQSRKERVLLILDDFDRLTDRRKSTLIQILKHRKPYCEMTVVVTCTTDKMYVELNDENVDYRSQNDSKPMKSKILSLWDKRIEIKGISQENKDEFVKRYFPSRLKNIFSHNKYFRLMNKSEEFYYSPTYLLFMAILLKDENIKSRTDFFIKIFNSLTKRALVRNKAINLEEEVDLFNHEEAEECDYRSLLLQFCKLAFDKLIQDQKSFTREEILYYCYGDERIFDLGFLRRITEYETHWHEIVRYETWHETILEFLAAYFLCTLLKRYSVKRLKKHYYIRLLMKNKILVEGDSLIVPFIIGLMKSQAYRVYEVFPKFFVRNFSDILFEIEYSYRNIISLLKDIFSYLEEYFLSFVLPFIILFCIILLMNEKETLK